MLKLAAWAEVRGNAAKAKHTRDRGLKDSWKVCVADASRVEYGVVIDAVVVGTWSSMQPYSEPGASALKPGERNGKRYGDSHRKKYGERYVGHLQHRRGGAMQGGGLGRRLQDQSSNESHV